MNKHSPPQKVKNSVSFAPAGLIIWHKEGLSEEWNRGLIVFIHEKGDKTN